MGASNFKTGFFLLVVFLNISQALDTLPKRNSSHGFQRMLFPDFRQTTDEDREVVNSLKECVEKWFATVGDPCISNAESSSKFNQLGRTYGNDVPVSEYKMVLKFMCQNILDCSNAGQCECPDSSVDSTRCNIPDQDLKQNCDREYKAALDLFNHRRTRRPSIIRKEIFPTLRMRNNGRSVSDPGQNFQYIILMAVIVFFVAAN